MAENKANNSAASVATAKAGDANDITRAYLDSILIEERLVGATVADTSTTIFGKHYATPLMMPAFSHLNKKAEGRNLMVEYAQAARELNTLNWVGMEPDDLYAEIAATGADTVRIIKPFADHDTILEQIAFAKSHGAVAVGVDIDHVFGNDGDYDVVDGNLMGPVTLSDLKAYVAAAGDVPFVAKGVLSSSDAQACLEAGVRGIVVSHHHGRMPFAIPPVVALQTILRDIPDLKQHMEIFVDCHIDSGVDAYKALALGADGVAPGRAIMQPLMQEGAAGVVEKVTSMNQELAMMMGYTGVADTQHFSADVLYTSAGEHLLAR